MYGEKSILKYFVQWFVKSAPLALPTQWSKWHLNNIKTMLDLTSKFGFFLLLFWSANSDLWLSETTFQSWLFPNWYLMLCSDPYLTGFGNSFFLVVFKSCGCDFGCSCISCVTLFHGCFSAIFYFQQFIDELLRCN